MTHALMVALAVVAAGCGPWVTTQESFYLQASHNWTFRRDHPEADRLFNAFDYGHAILYETLLTRPDAPASNLEQRIYAKLTEDVLVNPPRLPLEETTIEPTYARLVPEAKAMFDWAHVLHRQIYDVLARDGLDSVTKDREVGRLVRYYRARADLAFSIVPKNMSLMQEQPYSLAFRNDYPKFNGLIWAYHWLQVGLYEPLMVGGSAAERRAGVLAAVGRFRQMLSDPPRSMPHVMPMTPAIAPAFAARYPEAAIIFDNLHSMHDVVSDVLANDSVPPAAKRAVILQAARAFRDDTTETMTVAGWLRMSVGMGIENQGGPSVGFPAALPTPTMAYGAVMRHDRDGNMIGHHEDDVRPRSRGDRAGGKEQDAEAEDREHRQVPSLGLSRKAAKDPGYCSQQMVVFVSRRERGLQ